MEKYLGLHKVETRPLCSGNLLRQPFLQRIDGTPSPEEFTNAEYLHEHGFFIGNNHLITDKDFEELERLVEDYVNVQN